MDYVVGGVAALISGNVTPNRPRLIKRALTPTKHQPSPNVTPKSEFVEDRSIFLSPTMQKKKAIVKKSPKRIFENPDLETTDSNDGNKSLTSPKAEKVKKHLKDELDADSTMNKSMVSEKSPKTKIKNTTESVCLNEDNQNLSIQNSNENTPKKKKKKRNSLSHVSEKENVGESDTINSTVTPVNTAISPKKMKQRRKSIADVGDKIADENIVISPRQDLGNCKNNNSDVQVASTEEKTTPKKKNRKRKKKGNLQINEEKQNTGAFKIKETSTKESIEVQRVSKKKKKKQKKNKTAINESQTIQSMDTKNNEEQEDNSNDENTKSNVINPNAITNKDSDSEHDSDDEIESENEEVNKKALETADADESTDEEEEEKVEKPEKKEPVERNTEDEIKRTIFVGNVPFSTKCKKEIKKIFGKHGQIETIRIRTVPIKDGRFTPKMAVIKNELHPERSTVNVYVKYADHSSVEQALTENNTMLNENHLRVSRSDSTGAEHDPRCSIFIGNLPFALEDEVLREKFESCGEIKSVRIIRDKKTNAGKGFGYVNFLSKDGVELALQLSEEDLTIKNRILRVKRCTQATNKQRPTNQKKSFQPRGQGYQKQDERVQRNGQGNFNRHNQGKFEKKGQGRFQGRFQEEQGNQGRFERQGQGYQGKFQRQGQFQRQDHGVQGRFQRQEGGNDNKFQKQQKEEGEGAYRRIMNKRKTQESGEDPPNKRQKNINQPSKEKKTRKEFVGMTAEKKKKRKFDKGQKKKKALSEILTK